jgi:outer membrane protein assembly factor BamB
MAWAGQSSRPPFTSNQLRNTVVEYAGRAVVVDAMRGVFSLDPATGNGTKLTDLPGDSAVAQVDPVLAGDTLLAITGRTVQALDLRTARVTWQGAAPGTTVRPPIIAGDTVLWANTAEGTGSLLALDLATGTQRWQAGLGTVTQVGGVAANGDTVFTSTPPAAWDLRTGAQRWQAAVPGVTVGGPALSDDGQTLYVAGIDQANSTGLVAALDSATGAVRWHVQLDDAVISPLDALSVQQGLLVIPDLNGKVVVLDAASGVEQWRFTPPTDRLGNVTVARGAVWFMLENARLYGLDLHTGRPVARLTELEMSLNGSGLTQRPTFVGDRLVYPAGLIIVGLDMPQDAP